MYTLLKNQALGQLAERELIPFAAALIVAQVYFHWGNFALELVGFLFVWLALGYVMDLILGKLNNN